MKKTFFILTVVTVIISTAAGAFFLMSIMPSEEIKSYLNEFLWNIKSSSNYENIFHNSLKEWYLTLAALTVCGFFRPGVILSLIITARKCFICSFSIASFMFYYGAKGVLDAFIIALPFMISLTSLTLMCSAAATLAFTPERTDKYIIRPYMILSLTSALTFLASALTEGYIVPPLLMLLSAPI